MSIFLPIDKMMAFADIWQKERKNGKYQTMTNLEIVDAHDKLQKKFAEENSN